MAPGRSTPRYEASYTASEPPAELPALPLQEAVDRYERGIILTALQQCRGNVSRGSELLGVRRQGLQY